MVLTKYRVCTPCRRCSTKHYKPAALQSPSRCSPPPSSTQVLTPRLLHHSSTAANQPDSFDYLAVVKYNVPDSNHRSGDTAGI